MLEGCSLTDPPAGSVHPGEGWREGLQKHQAEVDVTWSHDWGQ